RDVRYTVKGDYLYAFVLKWPPNNKEYVEFALLAPGNRRISGIQSVEMLGHTGDLVWERHPDGLRVTFPAERPTDFAHCLKIHLEQK
ncbi:MAG: alpha-L-fucosidase, partial [Pirellulales bacterium]|nr:alpha-L-fucosidase [Pirellulales bacterium]